MTRAFKPLPGALVNPLHPLTRGTVGRWQLDTGGSGAHDCSGNNNHASLINGPAYVGAPFGGALRFVPASSQYVQVPKAVVSTPPLWFNCWFVTNDVSNVTTLQSITAAGGTVFFRTFIYGPSSAHLGIQTQTTAGANALAETSASVQAGVLYMASGVIESSTSRTIYLNGGSTGTNTTSVSDPPGLDRTYIGRNENAGFPEYFDGIIFSAIVGRGAPPQKFFQELYAAGPYAGLFSKDFVEDAVYAAAAAAGTFNPYFYHEHIARAA